MNFHLYDQNIQEIMLSMKRVTHAKCTMAATLPNNSTFKFLNQYISQYIHTAIVICTPFSTANPRHSSQNLRQFCGWNLLALCPCVGSQPDGWSLLHGEFASQDGAWWKERKRHVAGPYGVQPDFCPAVASPRSWIGHCGHSQWSDTRAPFLNVTSHNNIQMF